ncbi:MAG: DUF502 domain-containing protein [Candidatus Omnitrophota bacterium]|nr:MAG: DUF502 domain-containing protein [Candidatus Omnitrophota bacterium]
MFSNIKKYFIAGILVLLPFLITIYILINLFQFADSILGKFINIYLVETLGFYIPGLGLIIFLIIIFLIGFLTTHFLGKRLYFILDAALRRFPLIRLIYPSIKQIIEFLFTTQRQTFKKTVLVEYPRTGIWSMGFITNEGFQEAKDKTKKELLNIFIPSSPGPFTGFYILVPRQEVIILDITVEDAVKLLISGGLLNPVSPLKKG